jgi:uncharacterized lipoprotein YajG
MTSRTVVLAFSFVLVSGCACTAQQVNLRPTVAVNRMALGLGQGRPVHVEVADERPANALGTKVPVGGGEITPVQVPAEVVSDALVDGLDQLGFQPLRDRSNDPPTLRVELRAIDYKVAQGFVAGSLSVDVAMKAICVVESQHKYEKLYRGHHEESIQVVQSQSQNESYINDALSEAINQVLRDRDLLQCLATRAAP